MHYGKTRLLKFVRCKYEDQPTFFVNASNFMLHVSAFVPFRFHLLLLFYFYRPQTKLREGNVFTGVCLSKGVGGCLWSHGPGMGISGIRSFPEDGYFWYQVPFKRWVCLGHGYVQGWVCLQGWICRGVGNTPPPHPIPSEMIGNWAVRILLECFLVVYVVTQIKIVKIWTSTHK